ncbi:MULTISPECIES: hypothetical protein [Bacteria]|uniref:hypothetical protein n=1 Tax=Bacteria TaxID=2 RepID=UPI003C7A2D8B
MTVALLLPLPVPLAVGEVVELDGAAVGEAWTLRTSPGVRYVFPVASVVVPSGRARVTSCTIRVDEAGEALTELALVSLGAFPDLPAAGAGIALSGAEQAAATAGAQAAQWGGIDRPPRETAERFW